MSGRTFRSRWVVLWGFLFGGLCTGAAILMFLAAYRGGQVTDDAGDAEFKKIQKICEEQFRNGGGSDDSRCFRTSGAGANGTVKGMLAAGVLAALGLTQLISAARIGVTLTSEGVIIRNPLRTHRLAWADIESFRTEAGKARGMSYAFGRVDLFNGDTHRIEAICAMPWEDNESFQDERVIRALNAEVEARRADPDNAAHELPSFDFGNAPMRVADMFLSEEEAAALAAAAEARAESEDDEPSGEGEATEDDDGVEYEYEYEYVYEYEDGEEADEDAEDDDPDHVADEYDDGTADDDPDEMDYEIGADDESVAEATTMSHEAAVTRVIDDVLPLPVWTPVPVAAVPAVDFYDDPIGADDDPMDSVPSPVVVKVPPRDTAPRRDAAKEPATSPFTLGAKGLASLRTDPSATAEGHVVDHDRGAAGAPRKPLEVGADLTDVEQEPL